MRRIPSLALAVAFIAVGVLCTAAVAAPARLAELHAGSGSIDWQLNASFERTVLTVSTPSGAVLRREFAASQAPSFSLFDQKGQVREAGSYNYELRAVPAIDAGMRNRLAAAPASGDDHAAAAEQARAGLGDLVQSGSFAIIGGAFEMGGRDETARGPRNAAAPAMRNVTAADQVIPDDLIVQGSICAGFDCINNESFGFDTIKLKENNLRIKFEDTSVGTFPTNDWQLTANDSASGGQAKFSIEDITGVRVPFTVEAGASNNSIYVDSTARVGFRTSTPVLDIHINTANTPAIRLEQNSSGGFTAQTWDIGANEANFFVRDVTGGSLLPFRIRPGAPTSSLDIASDGDVGIGTSSPSTKLHVLSSAGTAKLLVQETNGTTVGREIAEFRNNGGVVFAMSDTSTPGTRWTMGTTGTTMFWDDQGDAPLEMTLTTGGNLTITGIYSPSDINLKRDIVRVQANDILAKLAAMPISTWTFKTDDIRHIGPMSQDFSAAFGLGINDKTISPNDMAGISLAAIQGLNQVVQDKDKEITELKSRLAALETMVQDLAHQRVGSEPQR